MYVSSRIPTSPGHSELHYIRNCVFSLPFLAQKKTIPFVRCCTSLSFPTEENPVHIFPGRWLTLLPCAPKVFEEKVVCSRNLGLELSSKHGFYLCGMTCGISWSRNFIDLEEIEANSWDEFPPRRNWQQKLPPEKVQRALTRNGTRWWFQIVFMFAAIWEKRFNLTDVFQLGWNHQLVNHLPNINFSGGKLAAEL